MLTLLSENIFVLVFTVTHAIYAAFYAICRRSRLAWRDLEPEMGNRGSLDMRRLLFSPRCVLESHVNCAPSSDHSSISEGVLQQIGAPGIALSTLVSLISLNNLPWLLISDSLLTLIYSPLLGNRSAHIPRYLLQMGASNKSYSRFVCRRNHLGVPRTLLHRVKHISEGQ